MAVKAKIFFRRFFIFMLFVVFAASILVYPGWYKRQINKVRGIYCVAQGDKYLRKGHFQQAIDEYRRGLALYPEHYGAWFNLGNLYVTYEDYYSAVDAYGKAINYNPNYVLARMNYGIISAEKLGDFNAAIAQYDKIIGIRRKLIYIPFIFSNLRSYKTNIGLAYYNKGVAFRQKSVYVDEKKENREIFLMKAIESFKEATKILKGDYDATYNLALAYHLNGDHNLAGLTYCKAIELAPTRYEAHYNLAVLLNRLKYYKEALKEMHKANSLLSGNGDTNQTRYIFDIMNDVTRSILSSDEGLDYLSGSFGQDEGIATGKIKYVNGRIVSSEELDNAMLKNLKTCSARSIFRDEDDLGDDEFDNY